MILGSLSPFFTGKVFRSSDFPSKGADEMGKVKTCFSYLMIRLNLSIQQSVFLDGRIRIHRPQ